MEEGRFSGQHKRILAVGEGLRRDGVEMIVYFPKLDSEYFEARLRQAGIEYRRMEISRPTKDLRLLVRYVLFFIPEIVALAYQLRKDQVNLVHCNGSWQIKGALAAKLVGRKVVWHLNDTRRPAFIKWIFTFLAAGLADTLIAAGIRVRTYYLQHRLLKEKRCEVIQAPVDTSKYDPAMVACKGVLAAYQGINILTVANVNPIKGLEHFVDMARMLNERYVNLHFHVVGGIYARQKNYYRKLQRRIRGYGLSNIYFHGFVADIETYLNECDIFVCSSLFEASPTSVWEAMAMGKAIVSTDVGDVGSIIRDGTNGFVVRPGSGKALADRVGLLIEDPNRRAEFGIRAREEAVRSLDVKVCLEAHRRLYRMTVSGDGRG